VPTTPRPSHPYFNHPIVWQGVKMAKPFVYIMIWCDMILYLFTAIGFTPCGSGQ